MAGILDEKVTLITGAGSGIGRATSKIFAREGARLVLADVVEAGRRDVAHGEGYRRGRDLCQDRLSPNLRTYGCYVGRFPRDHEAFAGVSL